MWIWSLFVVLCMANVMVCIHQSSYNEASWEKLGYRLSKDPSIRQVPVYTVRNPRQVHYYEPSKGDPSLVPQQRIVRSHSIIKPQYELSKGDPYLDHQHRIARSHSFIEPQYQPSKGDPYLDPQHRIARRHSFIEPQYYYESSKGDPSLVMQNRFTRSHSFIEPYYEGNTELPPVHETDLQGIKSRLEKRKQLQSLAQNDVEVKILDMHPLQLKEALILGLRSLAKRQEKQYSAVSELYHEDIPADSPEPVELSKASLYTEDNHENKLKESSEIYKYPSDTELNIEESNNSDEEYTDVLQEIPKTNVYQGKSFNQPSKSKIGGVEQGESKEIYENPVQSNVNYNDYKLIKDKSIEIHTEEYLKNKKPNLTRSVRSRNYQDYFTELPHYNTEPLLKGRNLEVSNIITPEKSSVNSIDYQNNKNNKEYFSTNNDDNEINNYFDELNNTNKPHKLKDQSLIDNKAIRLPPTEKIPIMEGVIEDPIMKNKVTDSDESSMQNTLERSNESPEFIVDSLIEEKKSKDSKEYENQKDKKEHSNESKYFGRETNNKEEKNVSKTSNELVSESIENDINSSEEIKPVKMKHIPLCPESMDPSFRVDTNKGIICSSDNDCKGEGEYCCHAYINLNKCWFW